MGQPNPPGDIPVFEGLGAEWNDIVSAIPEDQRATLAPKIKERLGAYEPLKQWEDFQKNGITPADAKTAMDVYSVVNNNPKLVYEELGKHLGITTQQAKEVVKELDTVPKPGQPGADNVNPEVAALKQQVDALTKIALNNHEQNNKEKLEAEADAALQKELADLNKKYTDVNEDEILLRMLAKGITAEQAYQEFTTLASNLRQTRPSPMLMGGGGAVPNRAIDVTKLDSGGTKSLVAQMMQNAATEAKK